MSRQTGSSKSDHQSLPIERGFPIRHLNDISEKESFGGARQWYRPVYTMHKWWARRLGSVFRSICLYTLIDDAEKVNVYEPGNGTQLGDFDEQKQDISEILDQVSLENPEPLWELYPKDITIEDKKILDPFMGGGTSLVEASRFGVECHGRDLNPVAWFVTKKEIEAGSTNVEDLEKAFEKVENRVKGKLKSYYKTPCPNHPEDHKADIMNSFWVKQLDCTSCGDTVSLFKDYRVGKGRFKNKGKYNVFCPDCESVVLVDDWKSSCECSNCSNEFVPQDGPVSGSNYTCPSCGQKYGITQAIQEQNGFDTKYYALEFHCSQCDAKGRSGSDVKGYREATAEDKNLYSQAVREFKTRSDLHEYIPDEKIRPGHMTSVRNPVFDHGYSNWSDMFNERQLLCFSLLLNEIDDLGNQNAKEYLLLAFSDMLRYRCLMTNYKESGNQLHDLFKTNSFDPPVTPAEGNIWGAEYGTGTFKSIWDMVIRGVKWSNQPTERYIKYPSGEKFPDTPNDSSLDSPETVETKPFNTPVGANAQVSQGDVRDLQEENEYDAVITDPPYYDNIIYSELSDFFYVWQKVLLEDTYDCFQPDATPRAESIVANPAENKGEEEFEIEMGEAFETIRNVLKEDGVLAFTYHHSEAESWAELLASLCDAGFEVTATYPITADVSKFTKGEAVEFDIVIVARPVKDRAPISWNSLRREIVRTAKETRMTLEETRDLSGGDIGVIEMGKCFQEYSKHHGEVHRAGNVMSAKDVVDRIYGIIQETDRGEEDIYLDLLEEHQPSYNDLNKHLKRSDASEQQMRDMQLFRRDGREFVLCQWGDEKRQAYVQSKVEEGNGDLTNLDKAHFLRYRFEQGKDPKEYLKRWNEDELRELCEGLAEVTDDETYLTMVGVNMPADSYGDE